MLRCPYGCDMNAALFIKNHPEIQEAGVRKFICPLCEQEIKVITKLLPEYTCEKMEKLTFWGKAKKAVQRKIDWLRTLFGG